MIETCKELGLPKEDAKAKILGKFDLKEKDADKYMEQYWISRA